METKIFYHIILFVAYVTAAIALIYQVITEQITYAQHIKELMCLLMFYIVSNVYVGSVSAKQFVASDNQ